MVHLVHSYSTDGTAGTYSTDGTDVIAGSYLAMVQTGTYMPSSYIFSFECLPPRL